MFIIDLLIELYSSHLPATAEKVIYWHKNGQFMPQKSSQIFLFVIS